jgi:hypothetical protein
MQRRRPRGVGVLDSHGRMFWRAQRMLGDLSGGIRPLLRLLVGNQYGMLLLHRVRPAWRLMPI